MTQYPETDDDYRKRVLPLMQSALGKECARTKTGRELDMLGAAMGVLREGHTHQHEPGWECPACGRKREQDGCDPCLGRLPGVKFACCGHRAVRGCTAVASGYIMFENGVTIRFHAGAAVDGVKYADQNDNGPTYGKPLHEGEFS